MKEYENQEFVVPINFYWKDLLKHLFRKKILYLPLKEKEEKFALVFPNLEYVRQFKKFVRERCKELKKEDKEHQLWMILQHIGGIIDKHVRPKISGEVFIEYFPEQCCNGDKKWIGGRLLWCKKCKRHIQHLTFEERQRFYEDLKIILGGRTDKDFVQEDVLHNTLQNSLKKIGSSKPEELWRP